MDAELVDLHASEQRRKRRTLVGFGAIALLAAAVVVLLLAIYRDPDVPDLDHPYLWEVVHENGQRGYLFGTLHVGYGIADLPDIVLDAQRRSKVTVTESDLFYASEHMPPSQPERLEPEEWDKLSTLSGISREDLYRIPTMHLVGVLILGVTPRKVEPMDRALQARAAKLGQRIAHLLEPAEPGDSDAIDLDERGLLPLLQQAIANDRVLRAQLRRMIKAYGKGEMQPGDAFGLITDLNPMWTDAIEEHVANGDVFVAVGAGHLIGPGSIVERLRQRGHSVLRLEP